MISYSIWKYMIIPFYTRGQMINFLPECRWSCGQTHWPLSQMIMVQIFLDDCKLFQHGHKHIIVPIVLNYIIIIKTQQLKDIVLQTIFVSIIIPHDTLINDFIGKTSRSNWVIALKLKVRSMVGPLCSL